MATSATTRTARSSARRDRERELIDATRALFDERGLQDAPIEDIARAVGINKALIYQHFGSKDELFVLTTTRYLDELAIQLEGVDPELGTLEKFERGWGVYVDYCLDHPAFVDCSISLMRQRARELRASVTDSVWLRLGQSMAACLSPLSRILAAGVDDGVFAIEDPDYTANFLYTQTLGAMHLARIGVGVRQAAPGIPDVFKVSRDQVRETCIAATLAAVRPQG
ncbi:MAG TPA: TetR/AcrR family transcriptional regulator [Solirubrobacteraceae bacterium]|nr:TetR/AcrR family transcriptional regulator [Solirubrobacteraceae bacterium]